MRHAPEHVLAHWFYAIDDFETSATDCYARIEEGVKQRRIPEARVSRVRHLEAGVGSAAREYLRIEGRGCVFDACAAPYGRGFFFSTWLAAPPLSGWLLLAWLALAALSWGVGFGLCQGALAAASSVFLLSGERANWLVAIFINAAGLPLTYAASVVLWFVGAHLAVRRGYVEERVVLALPLLGAAYARIFAPVTYYQLDTARMFGDLIHTAVLEAVEATTSAKGLRALSEAERKPVMRQIIG